MKKLQVGFPILTPRCTSFEPWTSHRPFEIIGEYDLVDLPDDTKTFEFEESVLLSTQPKYRREANHDTVCRQHEIRSQGNVGGNPELGDGNGRAGIFKGSSPDYALRRK